MENLAKKIEELENEKIKLFNIIQHIHINIDKDRNSKKFVILFSIGLFLSIIGIICVFDIIGGNYRGNASRELLIAGVIGAIFLFFAFKEEKNKNRLIEYQNQEIKNYYERITQINQKIDNLKNQVS